MALVSPTLPMHKLRLSRRTALIPSVALSLVLCGLGTALLQGPWHAPSPSTIAPTSMRGVDPRLVIPGRTLRIAATLTGGAFLSGTLYPALPGVNTLRLTLHRGTPVIHSARLNLIVTMSGMAMAPVRATVTAHHGVYAGTVRLPMFGRYQARLAAYVAEKSYTGTMTLMLGVPRP